MEAKNKVLWFAVAGAILVFVVGLAVGVGFRFFGGERVVTTSPGGENGGSPFLPTRKPVPPDVHVPEPGEKPADESVAVPVSTATAGPNVENQKFRVFNIVARNGKYEPSTIIVNVGDTVHIDFTAEGGTYDFFLPDFGLTQTAGPGVKKVVEFQANYSGSFTFSCKNLCPSGGMEGALIVK